MEIERPVVEEEWQTVSYTYAFHFEELAMYGFETFKDADWLQTLADVNDDVEGRLFLHALFISLLRVLEQSDETIYSWSEMVSLAFYRERFPWAKKCICHLMFRIVCEPLSTNLQFYEFFEGIFICYNLSNN